MNYIFGLFFFVWCAISGFAFADDFKGPLKGFNVNPFIKDEDLKFLSENGFDVVRISFGRLPLFTDSGDVDLNNVAVLDRLISVCKENNIKVVVDPHFGPGMKKRFTSTPDDSVWENEDIQKKWVELWVFLAGKYKNEKTVIGYDIFNEPNIRYVDYTNNKWVVLAKKIVGGIRGVDKTKTIIIQTPTGRDRNGNRVDRIDGINYLGDLVFENNIVISPHFYLPHKFSHQGVGKFKDRFEYPGFIDGVYWSKDELEEKLQPLLNFYKKTGVNIYVGEFGVVKWAGKSGTAYVLDLIDIFNENGWSWTLHSFRSAEDWSPEFGGEKNDTMHGIIKKMK